MTAQSPNKKQPVHYRWQWVPTRAGGRNIDIFEGREHIATTFTEEGAKRIIASLRASNTNSQSERAIREKVYDELGVLHGEDAKRFQEYMDAPPTDKDREMAKAAYEIIRKEDAKKKQRCEQAIREKVLGEINTEIEKFSKPDMEDCQIFHLNGMLYIKNRIQDSLLGEQKVVK